ncbi:MAG: rhamnogalacturonan acetylesterase [Bacteroidota bacterium]
MEKLTYIFLILTFFSCTKFDKKKNVIYLIGDSTMSEKSANKRPETGWGEMLGMFFREGIKIENHAKNGRSSRSFIAEKRWDVVLNELQKGDLVFIQFGHNDTKQDERFSTPETYGENLIRYITETRTKGAQPVLLTSIVRRRFDEAGQFYDTHGKYPDAVRKIAEEQKVTLIDLHRKSEKILKTMGELESKSLFLWLEKGEHPNYPEGKSDNTHFSPKGAKIMAQAAAEEIQKSNLDIKKHLLSATKLP